MPGTESCPRVRHHRELHGQQGLADVDHEPREELLRV
jgi:hypothetical protein